MVEKKNKNQQDINKIKDTTKYRKENDKHAKTKTLKLDKTTYFFKQCEDNACQPPHDSKLGFWSV